MLTFLNVKLNPTFFSLIEIKSIFFLRMRVQQCVCIRLHDNYNMIITSTRLILLIRFSWKIPGPHFKSLSIDPSDGVILPNETQVGMSSVLQ